MSSELIVVTKQYDWYITNDGVGKVSPVSEYPTQGRAGSGVIAMRLPAGSAGLAAAAIGRMDDNLIALTDRNKPYYMRLGRAPQVARGRNGGDIMMSLRSKESIVGVVIYQPRIAEPELELS